MSSALSVAGKQPGSKENDMKKKMNEIQNEDLLPEYDFTGKKGVRGKYTKALQKGYSVRVLKTDGTVTVRNFVPKESTVLLDPDVRAYFPDSESVNRALRSLIDLIPEKRTRRITENRAKYGGK